MLVIKSCFIYTVHYGPPSVSVGAVGAMMTAIIASMMDSCGDYIAYARTMGYPMPPKHAVNRGIAMEGIATILCGMNYTHFRNYFHPRFARTS